ncbi:MAG: hypothetical protein ACTTKY_02715 [Catonella sp.]
MFDISELNFVRTLRPFSNLQDPTNTIYDHLPYKKDINLIKESDVRLVSGNVVKYLQLIIEDPVIIDTNELSEIRIDEEHTLYKLEMARREKESQLMDDVDEDEIVSADTSPEEELVTGELDMESINALAAADENEDDYSFLNDDDD